MEHDFTNSRINRHRMYGGANGSKICIEYGGNEYMLKFPPKEKNNKKINYTNSCVSEYIACNIFASLGIKTQETLLGLYKDKIVVACRDFTDRGVIIQDFAYLKNTIINSEQNGYGTELSDILNTINEQQIMPSLKLITHFWDMFIGDTLVGNFDRHNGNWGFLNNTLKGEIDIAPIFDCGSCLYPQLNEKEMEHILINNAEIDKRVYVFPNSAIKQDDVKINYVRFLLTTENSDCIRSLIKIGNRIDLKTIYDIIDKTPYISDIQKEFYSVIVKERKEKIIDSALNRFQGTTKSLNCFD